MGKTGVINRDFTGEENNVYHDVIRLFKIYRAVNWRMQIKVNQVKHRIREEYGTDLDEFLDSIYQAGMDINQDLDDMKQRIEVINRSNKFLKLIDEAVELMRNFHPQGERYYWVLYYSYMSARKAENMLPVIRGMSAKYFSNGTWKETAKVRRIVEVTDTYIKFETDRIRYCIDFGMVESAVLPAAA